MTYMHKQQARGEIVTGLLYVDPLATDLHTALNTSDNALNTLNAAQLCPGSKALERSTRHYVSAYDAGAAPPRPWQPSCRSRQSRSCESEPTIGRRQHHVRGEPYSSPCPASMW